MADRSAQRITRRNFLMGLGAVSAVGLLAACGPTSTPPAATTPGGAAQPSNNQPVTLRLQARAGTEEDFWSDRAAAYNKLHPNVTVKPEFTPSGEYIQKLQTLIAGGTVGDVIHDFAGDASFQRFFVNGSTIALDQYIASEKVDLNQWFKPVIEMCKVNGKLGGLPLKGQPSRSALFFNTDLITKKGQQVPTMDWTVDDLTKMARGVTGGSGNDATYGYYFTYNDLEGWNQLALTFGDYLWSEDGKKANINTDPIMNAFKWMYDMVVTWKASPSPLATNPGPGDLFNSGYVGSYNSNWGGVPSIAKAAAAAKPPFKWSVVEFPKGPTGKRGNMVAGDMVCVTKFSTAPGEAFNLVNFLAGKESGIKLVQTSVAKGGSSTPGGRPDVYSSDELKQMSVFPPGFLDMQSKVMSETQPYRTPANYRGSEFTKAMKDKLDLLMQDKEKPTKAFFDAMQADCQAVLDQPSV